MYETAVSFKMGRSAQLRELKRLVLIGLFAEDIQSQYTRSRSREWNATAERSVLILARKLHKTKEARAGTICLSTNRPIDLSGNGRGDPGCCEPLAHTHVLHEYVLPVKQYLPPHIGQKYK